MKKIFACLLVMLLLCGSVSLAQVTPSGLPIVDEPVSFEMLVDDYGTPEEKIMYPILEEMTGVHVELQLYPYDVARERLNALLMGNDYPHVLAGWTLSTSDIVELGMSDGMLLPLEDLIETYAPNISALLDEPGVREAMTLPDGHIYTIPFLVKEPLVNYLPYINREWLDRLGLSVPTTPEELKEVLIAFRDEDANGNGDPNDEIPFSGTPDNLSLGMCAGWFGVDAYEKSEYPFFYRDGDTIRFAANTEEYREFIRYFADLYQEGLIDPELFTQDESMWTAKVNQGLVGVCISYNQPIEGSYVYLPVLKGCDEPVFHRSSNGTSLFRSQVALTDRCDEDMAATIIRWFDVTFDPDVSMQLEHGPLGDSIVKLDEHLFQMVDRSDWSAEKDETYAWYNYYTQSLPKNNKDNVLLSAGEDTPVPDYKAEADAAYEPYLNEIFPAVWLEDETDIRRASTLSVDINSYVKMKMAQWITGQANVDEEWDAYLAQLEQYGLTELTEIYQRILFG